MLYKEYGNTGKKVSVIGFGGMRFPKGEKGYDYDYCAEMMQKALDMGINYFDTAPMYCSNQGEDIYGRGFKSMKGRYYVSTKSMKTTEKELMQDLETSLRKMNKSKIDFFHIWSVLSLDAYRERMKKGGAYDAALKAKEQGLIDHITISTHCNGDEIEEIVKENKFDGILLGYNLLNFPYRQKGIKAAYEKGWGVVTMNPLAGGLIPQISDRLDFITKDNPDIIDSALSFNGSHKEISIVLAGMDSIEHVIHNCEIGNKINQDSLDTGKLSEYEKHLNKSFDKLCTGCGYCEPCPVNIEPSKYMMAYNRKVFGTRGNTLDFLRWHWGIPKERVNECMQCGQCEEKCTQHIPIIKRLEEIGTF
jgi:predicted aldo/keto reductase-like oxidoreductase